MALEPRLSRTETIVADVGSMMNSSWSGESFSRWMGFSGSEEGYKGLGQSFQPPHEGPFLSGGNNGHGLPQAESWAGSARFSSMGEYKSDNRNANSLSTRYPDNSYHYGSSSETIPPSLSHPEYNLPESSPTRAPPAETLSPRSIYPTTPNQRPHIWPPLPGSHLNSPRLSPLSATSQLAYPDSGDGGSPFMSTIHSPATSELIDYRGLKDMNHLHEAYPLPLHSDDYDLSATVPRHQLYNISEPSQEQFVNLSDVANLGGNSMTPLALRYQPPFDRESSIDQTSFVSQNPSSQVEEASLQRTGDAMAEDRGNKRKRVRTDVGSAAVKIEEMSPSSAADVKISRTKRPRGRPRKHPVVPSESSSIKAEPLSIPQPPSNTNHAPAAVDAGNKASTRTRRNTSRRLHVELTDTDASGDIDLSSDSHDSDVYIPSRSVSPRSRRSGRRSSASRGSSGGRGSAPRNKGRRDPRLVGSAAWALRKLEASERGPANVVSKGQDSTSSISKPRRSTLVPVPNVAKKSRGRKVPVDVLAQSGMGMVQIKQEEISSNEEPESSFASPDINMLNSEPHQFAATSSTYSLHSLLGTEGTTGQSHVEEDVYRSRKDSTGDQGMDASDETQGKHSQAISNEVKVVSGGIKKADGERRYVCTVEGCGKCFVRGEHLKRHVRSLHTWEKPHKCPHPGCDKSFSRRDNLGQHVRVHL